MKKRILSGFLSLILLLSLVCSTGITAFAAWGMRVDVRIFVDDQTEPYVLQGYNTEGYDFYMLQDIAYILKDTDRYFDITAADPTISYSSGSISSVTRSRIDLDLDATAPEDIDQYKVYQHSEYGTAELSGTAASFVTQNYYLSSDPDKRYTFSITNVNLIKDNALTWSKTFVRPADIFQMLDIYAVYDETLDAIVVKTNESFTTNLDLTGLHNGFFDSLHGVVTGTTDKIYYRNAISDEPVAIASTTKLMTYLLVMEAYDRGELDLNDPVPVTTEGVRLSKTEDRVLRNLDTDMEFNLSDLLDAMLIVSSNEAATLLGEYIAGSEENFVKLMNDRAQADDLKLTSAKFYNPHGLPVYTPHVFSSKLQNRMTADDMYTLACYVLEKYPQVLEITRTTEEQTIKSLDERFSYEYSTTNRLMFQLNGVDGLKTGTTNRSGACLVATMPLDPEDEDSVRFVAVVFGAEDNLERYWKAGVLLQYAKECYLAENPLVTPEGLTDELETDGEPDITDVDAATDNTVEGEDPDKSNPSTEHPEDETPAEPEGQDAINDAGEKGNGSNSEDEKDSSAGLESAISFMVF